MTRSLIALCVAFAMSLAACHAPAGRAENAGFDDFGPQQQVAADAANGFAGDGGTRSKANHASLFGLSPREAQAAGDDPAAKPESNAAAERMLIYRGDMRVEVARPEDAGRDFLAKVREWGGYLQSQQGATLTVRLPAPKFEDALAALRAMGRVLDESRSANDVTEEFVDLGIRLDTARKSRDRLLEILAKAEKVEDILKVEAELRRLTEEIERMEGRRKFLADQVALATLSATFQATAQAPPPPPRPKQRSRFPWIQRVGAESMMGGF
jgi:hypothetical protein